MPKTIRFHKIGGPENLVLEDVPSRQLEEGEVRLRVEAVGLNRAESLFFRGLYGEQPVLPSRVGYEAAGTVVAVEPGVFDPVPGPYIETLAAALAFGGTIFEYGGLSMQPTPFPFSAALGKGLSVRGYSMREVRRDPKVLNSATRYIYDRLRDGRLKPKIAKTFPLAQSFDAYKYLESNEQIGKVVITI